MAAKRGFLFVLFLLTFTASAFAQASVATYDGLLKAIRETRYASQARIEQAAEQEKVRESWETGKLIDEHILQFKERAEYGRQVIERLSNDLEMSQTELSLMVQFARAYPKNSPGNNLSWSHYRSLLSLNDPKEREEVTKLAIKEDWNRDRVREEIRRRKPGLSSPNDSVGDPLTEVKPGKAGVYRIVEIKGSKHYDLGFSTYFEIKDKKTEQNNPAEEDLYTYEARVIPEKIFDGDTFHAYVNLGFGVVLEQRLRLRALDAPEIFSAEGKEAKAVLEKALLRDNGKTLIKIAKSDDQYGRYLVDVWVKNKNINNELLASELFTAREK